MGQMYWIGASYPARPAEGGDDHGGGNKGGGDHGGDMPAQRWSYAGTFEVMPF